MTQSEATEWVASGCLRCVLLDRCGGHPFGDLFETDCVEANCCRVPERCQVMCPNNPRWLEFFRELRPYLDRTGRLSQPAISIPRYVPKILHGSRRDERLDWSGPVAVPLTQAVRCRPNTSSVAASYRERMMLKDDAEIILSGIQQDQPIEDFWRDFRSCGLDERIVELDPYAVIAPNYSQYLGVPRFDHVVNQVRQIAVVERLSDLGVTVIPHLSAIYEADWRFWERYLKSNETVRTVALHMSTGRRTLRGGQDAIDQVIQIREAVGRPLRLVVISPGIHLAQLSDRWGPRITYMNADPFSKTTRAYRELTLHRGKYEWLAASLLPGMALDSLLLSNLRLYAAWIEKKHKAARVGSREGRDTDIRSAGRLDEAHTQSIAPRAKSKSVQVEVATSRRGRSPFE